MAVCAPPLRLSPRQRAIVDLRLRRLGRREVAHVLGISPETVREHIDRARERNGLEDEVDLLLAAEREARRDDPGG